MTMPMNQLWSGSVYRGVDREDLEVRSCFSIKCFANVKETLQLYQPRVTGITKIPNLKNNISTCHRV